MTKTIDLLHGKIMRSLCILAVPIVMTYFIQMAYNFIDMIWIGRLGSGAVAGVGVAGMFTWFSNGHALSFSLAHNLRRPRSPKYRQRQQMLKTKPRSATT